MLKLLLFMISMSVDEQEEEDELVDDNEEQQRQLERLSCTPKSFSPPL